MALVLIRCPSCGADVDLEEGQTVVRCGYCRATSKLQQPAVGAPAPSPPSPRPAPVPARDKPTAAAESGGGGKAGIVMLLVAFVVAGAIGIPKLIAYYAFDHFEDGKRAREILTEAIPGEPSYLSVRLEKEQIYVEVRKGKGDVVGYHLRGRDLGPPAEADVAQVDARAFDVWDVKFALVRSMVVDAAKLGGAEVKSLTLARNLKRGMLVWTVELQNGELFLYDEHSVALPAEHLDLLHAPPADLVARISQAVGADAKLLALYINPGRLTVEVMAKGSQRDTDSLDLKRDGTFSEPTPRRSDEDAAELAAEAFALSDIDFALMFKLAEQTEKLLDGKRSYLHFDRTNGKIRYMINVRTGRGANRSASYDKSGKLTDRTK